MLWVWYGVLQSGDWRMYDSAQMLACPHVELPTRKKKVELPFRSHLASNLTSPYLPHSFPPSLTSLISLIHRPHPPLPPFPTPSPIRIRIQKIVWVVGRLRNIFSDLNSDPQHSTVHFSVLCCCPVLLSSVAILCCCPVLLSSVAILCCCPLLLCCCPLLLSSVAVLCCCPVLLSCVAALSCCPLLLSSVAALSCWLYCCPGPASVAVTLLPSDAPICCCLCRPKLGCLALASLATLFLPFSPLCLLLFALRKCFTPVVRVTNSPTLL
jgi:hypothetical protein